MRDSGRKGLLTAALLLAGSLLSGCSTPTVVAELPQDPAGTETDCGILRPLTGSRIRLAASLGAATLKVRPIRLDSSQARWMLTEGWDARPHEESDRPILIRGEEAGLRVPPPPCPGIEDPVFLLVGLHDDPQMPEQEKAVVRLQASGELVDQVRMSGSGSRALLQTGEAPASGLFTLNSEPAGTVSLHGMLLPLGRASIELDREYRDSIVASSVRQARYRVVPPPGASLHFGLAVTDRLFEAAAAGDVWGTEGSWTFSVILDQGEGERTIFEERLPADGSPSGQWHDRQVDLSEWSGSEIDLTLRVVPQGAPAPLALWGAPVVTEDLSSTDRPNILLVSIDTLRADRIGRTTAGRMITPELSALAGEGVTFTSCRTQAPSTLYGHGTMLTGLPPAGHGATTTAALPDGVPYLPALLAGESYETFAMTDDGLLDGRFGFNRGFDRFRNRYEPVEKKVDAAIKAIEATDGPWFLFFHTYEVHAPYDPPPEYAAAFTAGYDGALVQAKSSVDVMRVISRINNGRVEAGPSDVDHLQNLYDAEVMRTDAALGRLFEHLRRERQWDNTLIVVTSDHGEEFDEHGVIGWHSITCYEELQRVPLIVKPAFRVDPLTVETSVRSMDVAPTILDLVGREVPDAMWGGSLAGLMQGIPEPDRETLCEIEDGRGGAITVGGWKYHYRTETSVNDPRTFRRRIAKRGRYATEELYDLSADPHEQSNLIEQDPDRAASLGDLLRHRLNSASASLQALTRGHAPQERPRVDDEHMERLRALGYVD